MRQLKLPLEIEKLIDISDPVYTFCEVMDHIDLSRYFAVQYGLALVWAALYGKGGEELVQS